MIALGLGCVCGSFGLATWLATSRRKARTRALWRALTAAARLKGSELNAYEMADIIERVLGR
jgi:hypothetical protein